MKNVVGPKSALKDLLQGRLTLKDILEPIQRPSPEMIADIRTMMDKVIVDNRTEGSTYELYGFPFKFLTVFFSFC